MPFIHRRRIHFADTDAAGVVFFPRILALCHEAYEEALAAAGVSLRRLLEETRHLMPISRSEADYLRPLKLGDEVAVTVTPALAAPDTYTTAYEVVRLGQPDKVAARVLLRHVCVRTDTRGREALPRGVRAWVDAG